MNTNTPLPVLAYVVNIVKDVISDIKIEYASESVVNLKDGNDTIYLEQQVDGNENATILIKDPKDIIFSEDLLPALNNLHKEAKGAIKQELQSVTIIINGLNVETFLIFQAAKYEFDQISNSYEFVKALSKDATAVKSAFKFGSHNFNLTVANATDQILVSPEFAASFDASIKKTVESDALKVQHALNSNFK